jgi:hypothetical protein
MVSTLLGPVLSSLSILPLLAVAMAAASPRASSSIVCAAIVTLVACSAVHHLVPTSATFALDITAQLLLLLAILGTQIERRNEEKEQPEKEQPEKEQPPLSAAYRIVLAALVAWAVVSIVRPLECEWRTLMAVTWCMVPLYAVTLWGLPRRVLRDRWVRLTGAALFGAVLVGNTVPAAYVFAWPGLHLAAAACLWAVLRSLRNDAPYS